MAIAFMAHFSNNILLEYDEQVLLCTRVYFHYVPFVMTSKLSGTATYTLLGFFNFWESTARGKYRSMSVKFWLVLNANVNNEGNQSPI